MDANQKTITIMVYPTSLCMAHTQETGKLSDNPNWLPVDQSTFGEQIMRFSKSVIGKDSNKA
jgi:ribonuclease HIII